MQDPRSGRGVRDEHADRLRLFGNRPDYVGVAGKFRLARRSVGEHRSGQSHQLTGRRTLAVGSRVTPRLAWVGEISPSRPRQRH